MILCHYVILYLRMRMRIKLYSQHKVWFSLNLIFMYSFYTIYLGYRKNLKTWSWKSKPTLHVLQIKKRMHKEIGLFICTVSYYVPLARYCFLSGNVFMYMMHPASDSTCKRIYTNFPWTKMYVYSLRHMYISLSTSTNTQKPACPTGMWRLKVKARMHYSMLITT